MITPEMVQPAGVSFAVDAWTQGNCGGTLTVVCHLGELAGGDAVTLTVAVTTTAAGVITNTATVAANEFDPALANNTASAMTTVRHRLYLPVVTRGP